MRGNRRITLMEPRPTGEVGDFGQKEFGPPVPHVVWAVQEPMGSGTEGLLSGDVLGVAVKRVYKFPEDAVRRTRQREDGTTEQIVVNETWTVIDERGTELAIEAVGEANTGPRRRWLKILCDRKTAEGVRT